jgi:murein DD-endopeptidase MepM/ murein hydrolase activator NlpD
MKQLIITAICLIPVILIIRRLKTDRSIKILLSLLLLIIAGYISYSNYGAAREKEKNRLSGPENTPAPDMLISEPSPTAIGGEFRLTLTAAAEAFTVPTFPPTPDPIGIEDRITYRLPFEGSFPISQKYTEQTRAMTPVHTGIDYACPQGTKIRASTSGVVMAAAFDPAGYGFYVIIQHADGLATLYAHLDSFNVKVNQFVYKGAVIGISGSTGNSTGPHLHFEARRVWNDESSCFNPGLLPFD